MAVVNGYCTVEQVRAQLADDGGRLDEGLVIKAISAASRAIDDWCGRRFWKDPEPVTRLYRAEHRTRLRVHDIATTDGLELRTDSLVNGSWSMPPWEYGEDFLLAPLSADADGGAYAWWEVLADPGTFPVSASPRPTVQITARWGWSQIPAQVEEAAILRAVGLFKRKDSPWGVAGFGDFGAVRIRQDSDVAALLAPFQKVMA